MTKFMKNVFKNFLAYNNFIISYLHSTFMLFTFLSLRNHAHLLTFSHYVYFLLPLPCLAVSRESVLQSNDINHQCHQRLCYQQKNELEISIYLEHVYAFTMSFHGFFYHIYFHLKINLHTHIHAHFSSSSASLSFYDGFCGKF